MIKTMRLLAAGTICMLIAACGRGTSSRVDTANGAVTTTGDSAKTAAPTPTPGAPSPVPPSIDSVGTHGEDLYDDIAAGNWTHAKQLASALRTDLKQIPPTNSGAATELTALVDSLDTAIKSHSRLAALSTANQVTRVAAEMTRPYTSAAPVDVLLLDYYGRELEIWSSAKKIDRLKTTTVDIRRSWDAVRAPVLARKGDAVAKKMDAIVARIQAAASPAQFHSAAKPLLDAVDDLEKVFTTQ